MPVVKPMKTTSISFGSGAAKPDPSRPLRPTSGSPDRVDTDNEKDKAQQLKSGVRTTWKSHNPGRKA
jgi:hypothetical protein